MVSGASFAVTAGDSANITGVMLAGAGHGVAFLAAQDDLTRIAPDQQRAEVSAAFYVCIYLGVSVPIIGIGLVAVATTLFTAIAIFAAITGGGALVLAALAPVAPRRSRPSGRPGCRTGSGQDRASGTELTVTCHSPPGRPGPWWAGAGPCPQVMARGGQVPLAVPWPRTSARAISASTATSHTHCRAARTRWPPPARRDATAPGPG
jgi:hypothetical protein